MIDENKFESVVFGAGCFWCVEAIFLRVEGVESVVSGYSGGSLEDAQATRVHAEKDCARHVVLRHMIQQH